MSNITVFYNNKGGVSKTTTIYNVGAYLTKVLGRKVLLIDCDPQCNLTELAQAGVDDDFSSNTTIYQALQSRFAGEASRPDIASIKLWQSPIYNGLFLLQGDFELSLAESNFASSADRAITENIHEKNNYLALRRLFDGLSKHHEFDHVLVDVGPSSGALTRMAFLSSDQFLMPTTPDRFCNQAVGVLSKVITVWVERNKEISSTFKAFNLEELKGEPVFLGAVSQNFKSAAGKTKESYKKWESEISKSIKRSFLSGGSPGLPVGTGIKGSPYIAKIKDVGPLAPTSQMFGRAIFDLEETHSQYASSDGRKYYGAVWGTWVGRMADYSEEMRKISEVITNG